MSVAIDFRPPAAVPDSAWLALAADAATANPFHAPAAVAACMALPGVAVPEMLTAWDGDTLVGLLPVAARRVRGIALYVENWNPHVRALGEPLVLPGREAAFWATALPALATRPGRWLRLSALDADSPSTAALRAIRPGYVTRDYGRAVLHAGRSSADHAAAHVRGKVLKEHRRLRARLGDRGPLVFDRLGGDEAVDPWIDALFALEMTGWKGRDGVAASADPATEACFRHILRDAHAAGTLDFHRMRVGDGVVAMLANLETGDEAFQLKIAYDERWAAFSPGVLIEMAYLAHALDARGLARVDSCARANHPMIDRIWPDRRRIVSLAVPFADPVSRLACHAADQWRRARARPALSEDAA